MSSQAVTKTLLADGTEVWKSADGEVRASVPAPGVVLIAVIGPSTQATAPLMTSLVEREIALGRRVSWFGDYERMTTYDPDVRSALVDFTRRNREHFDVVGIFVQSRIVALAVTVANTMVGGFLETYTSREAFDRALGASLTRARTQRSEAHARR